VKLYVGVGAVLLVGGVMLYLMIDFIFKYA